MIGEAGKRSDGGEGKRWSIRGTSEIATREVKCLWIAAHAELDATKGLREFGTRCELGGAELESFSKRDTGEVAVGEVVRA